MTVIELRELLAKLPDSAHVLLYDSKDDRWYEPRLSVSQGAYSVILEIASPATAE